MLFHPLSPLHDLAAYPVLVDLFDGGRNEPFIAPFGVLLPNGGDILGDYTQHFSDLACAVVAQVVCGNLLQSRHGCPVPFFFWCIKVKAVPQFFLSWERLSAFTVPLVQLPYFVICQSETHIVREVCPVALCPELSEVFFQDKITHHDFLLYWNDPPPAGAGISCQEYRFVGSSAKGSSPWPFVLLGSVWLSDFILYLCDE